MDDFHFLDRWQQVEVMRLRKGHNERLNAHMYRKMNLATSPTCNCDLEDQTLETHTTEMFMLFWRQRDRA